MVIDICFFIIIEIIAFEHYHYEIKTNGHACKSGLKATIIIIIFEIR